VSSPRRPAVLNVCGGFAWSAPGTPATSANLPPVGRVEVPARKCPPKWPAVYARARARHSTKTAPLSTLPDQSAPADTTQGKPCSDALRQCRAGRPFPILQGASQTGTLVSAASTSVGQQPRHFRERSEYVWSQPAETPARASERPCIFSFARRVNRTAVVW
jgi:hypothetical protein